MTEDEARRVLLVRAVEEEDPSAVLPEVQAEAWHAAGDRADVPAWLVRRADFVLERLPASARDLVALELPPRELSVLLWLAAGLLGLASNGLSVGQRIHAVANPVTALLLWNLAVYGVMAWMRLRHRETKPEAAGPTPNPLRPLLAGLARIGVLWSRARGRRGEPAGGGSTPGATARVRLRFVGDYAAACAPPILSRCERLVHGGAIAFALGALAGIYLQGVAFEYRIEWGSTLVSSASVRAELAALLFLPARILLGSGFPDAVQLAQAATPQGAPAAIWFHVFALTTLFVVVLPRAALAFAARIHARRLAREIALPGADPYWHALVARPAPRAAAAFGDGVLAHFTLDTASATLLASLQAQLVADDIGATPAGRSPGVLGRKKAWYEGWRALVLRGFGAFPESERPRLVDARNGELAALVLRARQGTNPFAPELILLELAAFEAYWPLAPQRRGLRERLGLVPSLQREVRMAALVRAAELLGLPPGLGRTLRGALGATTRELSGTWSKVVTGAAAGTAIGALTLGIAAPVAAAVIGKAVGAGGLLALKAGFAALGGHLVVGAGLGAAGGTVFVVGGGALLGSGTLPPATSGAAALTPATALLGSAKIEVFLRQVVAGRHHEAATFASILDELRASVSRLREELPAFRLDPAQSPRLVQEREKVIGILERVAHRNEAWGRQHGMM